MKWAMKSIFNLLYNNLLFFLPMLDDETQRHLADFEENEPVFEDLDFDASAEADDFEEDYLIDDDDD